MDDSEEILGTKDIELFLDKKVIVLMKDGKCLEGIFRSFDQFNNITLEEAKEKVFSNDCYVEKEIELTVIRGESIFFFGIGELNMEKYKLKYSLN